MPPHLSGTESAILNRESGDSESCDSNRASLKVALNIDRRCDSDGDSESIFRSSTRFESFFCFSLWNFWRFQAHNSGNRVEIRDSVPLSSPHT